MGSHRQNKRIRSLGGRRSTVWKISQFIKALNATDWVRQGHDYYAAHTSGKCPYCQQTLPVGFEEEIAACFDAQYQQDIADLREFEAV